MMTTRGGGGGKETPTKAERFIMKFSGIIEDEVGVLLTELSEGKKTKDMVLKKMNDIIGKACNTVLGIKDR